MGCDSEMRQESRGTCLLQQGAGWPVGAWEGVEGCRHDQGAMEAAEARTEPGQGQVY